jgi:uncharacterized protein YdiU (UPF0061 family)
MMAEKLGLSRFITGSDEPLLNEMLDLLQLVETDMTIFFRQLALLPATTSRPNQGRLVNIDDSLRPFAEAWYQPEAITPEYRLRVSKWLTAYLHRRHQDKLPDNERVARMNRVNPKYVLRNSLAQLAIDRAENGDFSMVQEILNLLRRPYDEQPEREHFFSKRPEWARNRPGCSMLSCSS